MSLPAVSELCGSLPIFIEVWHPSTTLSQASTKKATFIHSVWVFNALIPKGVGE